MKTVLRLALVPCLLLASCAAPGSGDSAPPRELKIMSYNIHYAVGMDGERDLERIAQVILSADPDLVGLQEIGNRAMADELAELTGLRSVFGPAKGNENDYGDALLTKHPFGWVGGEALPTASASRYQAMAVDVDLAELYGPGASIRFVNTHYDWTDSLGSQEARRASADVIERGFFDDTSAVAVLAGDLNATPASLPLSDLEAFGWHHSPIGQPLLTHGAPNPTVQIDYVLVRPRAAWEVVGVEVLDEPVASDHFPIVLTARLVR